MVGSGVMVSEGDVGDSENKYSNRVANSKLLGEKAKEMKQDTMYFIINYDIHIAYCIW